MVEGGRRKVEEEEEEGNGSASNVHEMSVIFPSIFTSDPACSVERKLMNSECITVSDIPIGISMKEENEYRMLLLKSNRRELIELSPETYNNE